MLPRLELCCLPTPCHRCDRLSQDLGIELWIKRDDLTGFGGGGNKGRKLEYLMADALNQGAHRIVTCGSTQSNFIRQCSAACSVAGIDFTAICMAMPYDQAYGKPTGEVPYVGGNLILDSLLGCELIEIPDDDWLVLFEKSDEIAESYRKRGQNVVQIPIGGSSPMGAFAFTKAAQEIGSDWDFIVTATSSGSTHAGLAWSFYGTKTQIIGISCDPEEDLADDLLRLTNGIDLLSGDIKGMVKSDFRLCRDYYGAGYNIPSHEGQVAIETMARREGVFLDPVYSGKAFSGLMGLARNGELSGRVLFWHTGGFPTLFAGHSRR